MSELVRKMQGTGSRLAGIITVAYLELNGKSNDLGNYVTEHFHKSSLYNETFTPERIYFITRFGTDLAAFFLVTCSLYAVISLSHKKEKMEKPIY